MNTDVPVVSLPDEVREALSELHRAGAEFPLVQFPYDPPFRFSEPVGERRAAMGAVYAFFDDPGCCEALALLDYLREPLVLGRSTVCSRKVMEYGVCGFGVFSRSYMASEDPRAGYMTNASIFELVDSVEDPSGIVDRLVEGLRAGAEAFRERPAVRIAA